MFAEILNYQEKKGMENLKGEATIVVGPYYLSEEEAEKGYFTEHEVRRMA